MPVADTPAQLTQNSIALLGCLSTLHGWSETLVEKNPHILLKVNLNEYSATHSVLMTGVPLTCMDNVTFVHIKQHLPVC